MLFLCLSSPIGASSQPLKPEQAFSFQSRLQKNDRIEIRFQVKPGYYLYRDPFKFSIDSGPLKLGIPQFPTGQVKEDPIFGKTVIFRGEGTITVPITAVKSDDRPITLVITYQGCSDGGFCYPPKTVRILLTPQSPIDGSITKQAIQKRGEPSGSPQAPTVPFSGEGGTSGDLIRLLSEGTFIWILMSFFGFGLLLSFTPCVFPMVPIISSIILAQGKDLTKRRAFILSLSYVSGMALTYSTIGVAAGLSGRLFSAVFQNPWVLGAFGLLFVALAFSMFGLYELKIPSIIQNKLIHTSNRLQGGTFLGVFIMGLLSALIVSPCVSAPLVGALLYISQTGNVFLGGSALLALSLGMGVPLLIIGTSAGAFLPQAGAWMTAVQRFFGVLLLAMALWLVSPILPLTVQMILWGALLIISAVYLSALDPLPVPSPGMAKFRKGIGFISLILGAALLVGALTGGGDLLQPLSGFRNLLSPGSPGPASSSLVFQRITTLKEFDFYSGAAQGKPIMLYVSADWCTSCREMELWTFPDPQVKEKLKGIRLLKADITQTNQETDALLKKFQLFGPPAVLFFDEWGKEIPGTRVIGFQGAGEFLIVLNKTLSLIY